MSRPATMRCPLRSRQSHSRRHLLHRAMSLPECMAALVINSLLLLAVATAFVTSTSTVRDNDNFFRASQAARISVSQMVNEVRCCDSVQVYSDHINVLRPTQALTPNETMRTFAYDSAHSRLTLQISYSNGTASPVYTMASNVSSAVLGPADTGMDSNNAQVVVRVPLTLTVAIGSDQVVLNGSAAPRRALRY